MRVLGFAVAVLSGAASVSCGTSTPMTAMCVEGLSRECACTDGSSGAQVCVQGQFGRCVCTVADAGVHDAGGAGGDGGFGGAGGTSATGGSGGSTGGVGGGGGMDGVAGTGGGGGAGGDGCPIVETEWCDGRDNDCDGVVDNGHVCPDATVQNTIPFSGRAYLVGTTQEGLSGRDALQAFWPGLSETYLTGFQSLSKDFIFQPGTGRIHYHATFTGVLADLDGVPDEIVETPPCYEQAGGDFGFDASGMIHYRCSKTLRRGNGELLAQEIGVIAAVLGDGRTIVVRDPDFIKKYQFYSVIGVDGAEVARLDPRDEFVGEFEPHPQAATVSEDGTEAFVLFQRTWGQLGQEFVAFKLTAENQWLLVRRVPVDRFGFSLVLPDGNVFVRETFSPEDGHNHRIVGYLADGTKTVLWREVDATEVRAHGHTQLLSGP